MRKYAFAALIVFAALNGAACQKQIFNEGGGNPIGASTTTVVTEVTVTASHVFLTLNACPATVILTAKVWGTGNVSQDVSWTYAGGGEFSSSGNTATIHISRAGEHSATATSKQDPTSRSGNVKVTAVGDCGGAPPTGGLNMHFTGHPLRINRGESSRLEWNVTGATICKGEGLWSGQRTFRGEMIVSPQESGNYHLNCDGVYKTVYIEVIQPSPPPGGGGGGGGGGTPTPTPPPAPTPTPSGEFSISYAPAGGTVGLGVFSQLVPTCKMGNDVIVCPPLWWYSTVPNTIAVVPENRTYSNDPVWGTGSRSGGEIVGRKVGQATVCVHRKSNASPSFCSAKVVQ